MPTATVTMIYCVHPATGTDIGVIQALAGLSETFTPQEIGGVRALDFVKALPGVIQAIDTARSDPDNLYVTTDTGGGRDNA